MTFPIFHSESRSILSAVTGFLAEAGFTHSLSPSRNCTYGCTYCYVPTMRIFGGLHQEDWEHWGQFTTYKRNAAQLLRKELRADQIIYLSPLVDPYQPAERLERAMPAILGAIIQRPPKVLVIQTRSPLILRDLPILKELGARTALRVSFSITTSDDQIRRRFEPHCEQNSARLEAVKTLTVNGIAAYTTLAPLLPGDPELLANNAMDASPHNLIGDPFHVRSTKKSGATTRPGAWKVAAAGGWDRWFDPAFQAEIVARIQKIARARGRTFTVGPLGFGQLAKLS